MKNDSQNTNNGINFPGLLTIVFITLKLIGKIDWSWWWVLSPLLISTAIVWVCTTMTTFVELYKRRK